MSGWVGGWRLQVSFPSPPPLSWPPSHIPRLIPVWCDGHSASRAGLIAVLHPFAGGNAYGQLGDGSTTASIVPVAVLGGGTWSAVSAGGFFTCGLKTGSSLFCWGEDGEGSVEGMDNCYLIVEPPLDIATPPGCEGHGPSRAGLIAACDPFAGWNVWGQLGDASTNSSMAPVAVSGGGTWSAVSAGNGHTCGIKTGGALLCWGEGGVGKSGWGVWVRVRVGVFAFPAFVLSLIYVQRCFLSSSPANT